jgi:hypothetical protein
MHAPICRRCERSKYGTYSTITRENRRENRYECSKREERHMKKAEKKK